MISFALEESGINDDLDLAGKGRSQAVIMALIWLLVDGDNGGFSFSTGGDRQQ